MFVGDVCLKAVYLFEFVMFSFVYNARPPRELTEIVLFKRNLRSLMNDDMFYSCFSRPFAA